MNEDDRWWQKDVYCFAFDLYNYLFRKRGMSEYIPPSVRGCGGESHFTEETGKTVLYTWHMSRDMYRHICTATYPAFAKNRSYLLVFLREICEKCEPQNVFLKVINMSVVILETFIFLLEKKNTKFFPSVATFWAYLFGNFFKDKFFAEGGWQTFKLSVVESARHYDQVAGHFEEGFIFTMRDVARIQGLPYPTELKPRPLPKSKSCGSSLGKAPESAKRKQLPRTTDHEKSIPSLCVEHGNSELPGGDFDKSLNKTSTKNTCGHLCLARESRKVSKNFAINIRKESHLATVGDNERVPPLHPGIELEPPPAVSSEETGGVRRKTHSRGQSYAMRKSSKQLQGSSNRQSTLEDDQKPKPKPKPCSQSSNPQVAKRQIFNTFQNLMHNKQSSTSVNMCDKEQNTPSAESLTLDDFLNNELPPSVSEDSRTTCELNPAVSKLCSNLNELEIDSEKKTSFNLGTSVDFKAAQPSSEENSNKNRLPSNSVLDKNTADATTRNENMKSRLTIPVKSKKKNKRHIVNDLPCV